MEIIKNLSVNLALAHLIMCLGVGWVYYDPNWYSYALFGCGWFYRMTLPYRNHRESRLPFMATMAGAVFLSWLGEIGLRDVLYRAWDERVSFMPIAALSLFALWYLARDWSYFLELEDAEIDEFYQIEPRRYPTPWWKFRWK